VLGALAFPSKLVCYSVEAYISTTGMNDSYCLRINVDGKTEFWDLLEANLVQWVLWYC
jgi:hypothetical protein